MFLIRRLVWFASGVSVGFGGAMWIRRRVRRAVERYVPDRVAAEVSSSVRRIGTGLRDAVDEGRVAMRDREASLRSDLRPGSPGSRATRHAERRHDHAARNGPHQPGRAPSPPLG